ncbi:MAG: TolC family protein [Firmicutes bacterium]|nr:TolC family protein [Bacillota bacterium]
MKKIKLPAAFLGLAVMAGLTLGVFAQPYTAEAKILSELPKQEVVDEVTGEVVKPSDEVVKPELTGEVKQISLNEAMELALANSAAVLQAANTLEDAKIDYEQAAEAGKSLNKMLGRPDKGRLNQQQYQVVVMLPEVMEKTMEIQSYAYDTQVAAAKIQVIQSYYTALCNEKAEQAAEYSYTKALNQQKTVKLRYEQGMATKLEVLQAEIQVNSAKAALDAAKTTTVQGKRNFSILIGQDAETNWTPTSDLTFEPLMISNVDAKAKEMMETSPTVGISKATFEIAELTYDFNNKFSADFTYAGQIAELTYDSAKISYENTQRQTYSAAKAMLENLNLVRSQYEIYEDSQELLEEVYRLSELQYANGLNTQNDVQAAAGDIVSNDAKRLQALLNYNILKTTIEQGIIGTGENK